MVRDFILTLCNLDLAYVKINIMAGVKKQFVCTNCGNSSLKWQGRCSQCGEWNTLAEQLVKGSSAGSGNKASSGISGQIQQLSDVTQHAQSRFLSGIGEFDSVLGGGLVQGS